MAKARSKPAGIDEHARTIAKAIAKGGLPQPTPEMEQFLEARSVDIFAAAEGACRHLPPAGDDEALGVGYLFLLQMLLERARYRADRGFADAIDLIATFQAALVTRAEAGEIDGTMLAYLGGALQQAKIAASPELTAVSAKLGIEDDEAMLPADIGLALDQLLEASGRDPFVLVGTFAQSSHTLPDESKAALIMHFGVDDRPAARAAAVLFLLDPSAAARDAAAAVLLQAATLLSSVDLRRLIAMRNWRPEHERADVDAIIHKMRAAGIACAAWEKNVVTPLQASPIDGSAGQVFQFVAPAGRKKRISSILTRNGVVDAFSASPQTSRQAARAVDASAADVPMLDVDRSYLDRMVSHHLALTVAGGEVPPLGLLEVAEVIGGADWQPQRIDFRAALNELIAELPEELRDPDQIDTALADSDALIDLDEIEDAWFEDNAELQEVVRSTSRRARDQLVTQLLLGDGAIAVHRERWAEVFVCTALWMREAPAGEEMCWSDLAVVARAVLEGHDLTKIGLMRDIAERTVEFLSEEPDDDAW
jgi:hypothetical protein